MKLFQYLSLTAPMVGHGLAQIKGAEGSKIEVTPQGIDPAIKDLAQKYTGPDQTGTFEGDAVAIAITKTENGLVEGDYIVRLADKYITGFLRPMINDCNRKIGFDVFEKRAMSELSTMQKVVEFMKGEAQDGGRLFLKDLGKIPKIVDNIAPFGVGLVKAETTVAVAGTVGAVSVGVLAWLCFQGTDDHKVPVTLRIPKEEVGKVVDDDTKSGPDQNKKCPEEKPQCQKMVNDECDGDKDRKCTLGELKDCPCIREPVGNVHPELTKDWFDTQQKILKYVSELEEEKPDWCHYQAQPGPGHQGAKGSNDRTPTEYCACGDDTLKPTVTLSIAADNTETPCPFQKKEDGKEVQFFEKQAVDSGGAPAAQGDIRDPSKADKQCYGDGKGLKCKANAIDENYSKGYIRTFCDAHGKEMVKPDSGDIKQDPNINANGKKPNAVEYHITVGWRPGCQSTQGDEINLGAPIPMEPKTTCYEILIDHLKCPGKHGGWTEVDCLTYTFSPRNWGSHFIGNLPCDEPK